MNRQWLLAHHPEDAVTPDCFRYNEAAPSIRAAPGRVLMRWELLQCPPTLRNWISGKRDSFHPVIEIGSPITTLALGWVQESDNPAFPAGARLFGVGAWQDEQWIDPAAGYRTIPDDMSSIDAMGIFGINALTAYVGFKRIGQPKKGETLVVSGAAGSVGSIAAQLGRIQGCRVIAICGGESKRRWLQEQCGVADVIDYKSENVAARIRALAPNGVDIYFDNVGGTMLRDVIAQMNKFGRVVLCGQIATYDMGEDNQTQPLDMMRIIYGNMRLQGFIVRDHADMFDAAIADLRNWDREGLIAHREDVRDGFKNIPDVFRDLFAGRNNGTLLARIADSKGNAI